MQEKGRVAMQREFRDTAGDRAHVLPGQAGVLQRLNDDGTAAVLFDWVMYPVTSQKQPKASVEVNVPFEALKAI